MWGSVRLAMRARLSLFSFSLSRVALLLLQIADSLANNSHVTYLPSQKAGDWRRRAARTAGPLRSPRARAYCAQPSFSASAVSLQWRPRFVTLVYCSRPSSLHLMSVLFFLSRARSRLLAGLTGARDARSRGHRPACFCRSARCTHSLLLQPEVPFSDPFLTSRAAALSRAPPPVAHPATVPSRRPPRTYRPPARTVPPERSALQHTLRAPAQP